VRNVFYHSRPDDSAIREAELRAFEEESNARKEKAKAREEAARKAREQRAELEKARADALKAEEAEKVRERESVIQADIRARVAPPAGPAEPQDAGQTIQDNEVKDLPKPIMMTRKDADPMKEPEVVCFLARALTCPVSLIRTRV